MIWYDVNGTLQIVIIISVCHLVTTRLRLEMCPV